jgi:response regulator RpfG family c-di-GMP phosphodiesterase
VFDEHRYDIKINFVSTSDEVFAHLTQCDKSKVRFPSLILLDYNAAPSNAVEILNELKSSASKYSHVPVVVLSGSVKEDIVRECYAAGASSFIQKPVKALDTDSKIGSFFKYWFETVVLP